MAKKQNEDVSAEKNDKALRLDILKADLTNKERELGALAVAAKDVDNRKRLVGEQLEIRKRIHQLSQENFGVVAPKWSWESMPEVLDLTRKLSDNEFQFKVMELEAHIKQFDKNLEMYKAQSESLMKSREKLLAEIASLGA
jgi:hypothetical protein